jgi:hypothetical protein
LRTVGSHDLLCQTLQQQIKHGEINVRFLSQADFPKRGKDSQDNATNALQLQVQVSLVTAPAGQFPQRLKPYAPSNGYLCSWSWK